MLYIVWIWWPFRSEEIAVMLPLVTETCLAQEWLCKHADVAAALSFAVVLKLRWCCEAKVPLSVSIQRWIFPSLLSCMCICCWEKVSESYVSQMLCRSFRTHIRSLRSLIQPALTQLCCKVRASCSVWSLGQREEFLQFKRWDRPSRAAG